MLVTTTAFLQPHHSLVEETCGAEEFHCANSESVTSSTGVEVPKDSKNVLQPAQLLDLE